MIVLTTSTSPQEIRFVPRQDVLSGKIIVTDKNTRTSTEIIVSFSVDGNYNSTTASFNLIEGGRYSLEIVSDFDDVIYRDTIICTDQSAHDRYNIQQGEYIQAETSDNSYVVIND